MKNIKVSVLCITYNHEKFISKAIEGFVNQKLKFNYEVIIGDDCSTDNTSNIINKYFKQYPEIIKPILRKKNIGYMNNFVDIFSHCNGDYIALCEGDDYWIDEFKLQKQIDFLERNPDFSMCSHAVKTIFEDVEEKYPFVAPLEVSSFKDIIEHGHFVPTLSIVFRKKVLKELPLWFKDLWVSDIPLILLLTLKGKNYYFKEIMGIKRKHSGGITQNPSKNKNKEYQINILRSRIFFYEKLLKMCNIDDRRLLKKELSKKYFHLSFYYLYCTF
jgi:glycosyltransferase involved in cell wall biosynthesis